MSAQPLGAERSSGAPPPPAGRTENLALIFQEIFTAIVRLRSNRSDITNAELFRGQVRQAVKLAEQDAKRRSYVDDDIRLAIYAVVAFLDETILNLHNPIFDDWVRKPLQEEFFGRHVAGEIFFDHLREILGRRDTHEVADLLEVYHLCILLGYTGRYSIGGKGELRAIREEVAEKIQRIRKSRSDLSPHWTLPSETVRGSYIDPLLRKFTIALLACVALALLLFVAYKISLGSGISALRALTSQGPG